MTLSTIFRKLFRLSAPAAFWLGVWQLAAMAVDRSLLLPGPATVFSSLCRLAALPLFWQSTAHTLLRIFGGLAAGAALGVLLALLTSFFRFADLILSPAVRVVRAVPVASFILLVLLWTRSGRVPVVISALMALPVVWGNVSTGIGQTDPQLLELCFAYRFSAFKKLRLLYIPSVLPYLSSGCATAMGLAWKSGVAAEVLCLPRLAVGTQIYYSKLYLETPSLFAWTLVTVALSLLLERALRALLRPFEKGGPSM